jgi:hypothetical protein
MIITPGMQYYLNDISAPFSVVATTTAVSTIIAFCVDVHASRPTLDTIKSCDTERRIKAYFFRLLTTGGSIQ